MVRSLLIVLLALATGCVPRASQRWPVMGSYAQVEAVGRDAARAVEAARAAFDRADASLSNWKEDSPLSRLNRAGEGPVEDPILRGCLDRAFALARSTGGAFDPTVGPLVVAGGFRPGRAPDRPLDAVGWEKVEVGPGARTIRFTAPGMEIDTGGIGKGCALDVAAEALRPLRVRRALLDLGGNLLAYGRGPWRIGLRDPGTDDLLGTLEVHAGAVSTSSQAENPGHLLDPRTGRPVHNGLLSVTVVAADGTASDALSTALFVAGPERAADLLGAHPGAAAVLLLPSEVRASASLEGRLTTAGRPVRFDLP